MASSGAVRGWGSTVEIGVGDPLVYTKIVGVEEFAFPDQTPDVEDATHLESPGDTEESIRGMRKQATWTINLHYVPGSATDLLLAGLDASEATVELRLTPAGATAVSYAAYVLNYHPTTINARNKMMASLTMVVMAEVVA